jgi:ferredoxin
MIRCPIPPCKPASIDYAREMRLCQVTFVQGDQRWVAEVPEGDSLLEAAHAVEAPVYTLCGGIAACIQCRVRIVEGEASLTPPNNLERDRLGNIFHITHERLACQARVSGDVVVEALPVQLPKKKTLTSIRLPKRR